MYDVGERVLTPEGEAIVIACNDTLDRVITDRGSFRTARVSEWLDVKAITATPESLEAWLEAPARPARDERIIGEARPCRCTCGKRGNCHRLVHVDVVAEVDVEVFPHTSITGECRCLMKDCACTH